MIHGRLREYKYFVEKNGKEKTGTVQAETAYEASLLVCAANCVDVCTVVYNRPL